MAERVDGRMKLAVLGGFLGSGKTTWLRHQLHAGLFRDAFVVVNEAAELPVDGVLLGGSGRVTMLAGGCACCEALTELLALLRSVADQRHDTRVERIVLETSGLADPGRIVEAIRADPVLVHHIVVSEIVVTVDALYGLDQLRFEPLGRRQVEVADRLVVTKVDAAPPSPTARLTATLQRLNPGAALAGAVRGSPAPLPHDPEALPDILPETGGSAAAPPISATKLSLDADVDWPAFSVWLSALLHARGDDVMRVKGVVRTPAGRLLLQSVRRAVQSPELLPDEIEECGEDDAVAVIGRGFAADDLRRSLRAFVTGRQCRSPPARSH